MVSHRALIMCRLVIESISKYISFPRFHLKTSFYWGSETHNIFMWGLFWIGSSAKIIMISKSLFREEVRGVKILPKEDTETRINWKLCPQNVKFGWNCSIVRGSSCLIVVIEWSGVRVRGNVGDRGTSRSKQPSPAISCHSLNIPSASVPGPDHLTPEIAGAVAMFCWPINERILFLIPHK